jgi:hypothetical protein
MIVQNYNGRPLSLFTLREISENKAKIAPLRLAIYYGMTDYGISELSSTSEDAMQIE